MKRSKIEVLIADRQTLFAEGMASLLLQESDIEFVGIALNTADCLEIVKKAYPDVVLLDINLSDVCSVDIMDWINKEFPDTKIIILTGQSPEEFIEVSFVQGLAGFLLKDCTKNEIVTAIRKAIKGEVYLSQNLSVYLKPIPAHLRSRMNDSDPFLFHNASLNVNNSQEVLTERESEILILIAKGLRNKEIAASLGISKRTVEYHVSNILEKLGAKSRLEAVLNYKEIRRGIM
ncbi:MAG: response regulator transcription factor [Dehalobacter sp. 4CP]|uniref:LuxR C-terminal-related transcriptional regulator n=1 Tax=Dehalobacter sp. CP TaxID=2594474 RepID=UPI0013CBF850|nr:response regulator transcription factor [Dehalobacter sp. 4CP]